MDSTQDTVKDQGAVVRHGSRQGGQLGGVKAKIPFSVAERSVKSHQDRLVLLISPGEVAARKLDLLQEAGVEGISEKLH